VLKWQDVVDSESNTVPGLKGTGSKLKELVNGWRRSMRASTEKAESTLSAVELALNRKCPREGRASLPPKCEKTPEASHLEQE